MYNLDFRMKNQALNDYNKNFWVSPYRAIDKIKILNTIFKIKNIITCIIKH